MNDSTQLRFTTGGGGVVSLFGLPFLFAGLFVILAPAFGVVIHNESGGTASPGLRFALGGLFSLIGSALVFGRAGVILDRGREELSQWWGLLVPFHKRTRSLGDFELVALEREVRTTRSKNGTQSYVVYPVKLRAVDGEDEELESPRARQLARRRAEQVAKFMHLGMADSSQGPETVRAAGTLDHCLREQLRDDPPAAPAQPALGAASYGVEGRTAVLEVPGPSFLRAGGPRGVMTLIPALFFSGFVGMMMLPGTHGPFRAFVLAFMGLPVLLSLAPLVLALVAARTRERIRITPDALEIERQGPLRTRTQRVPMEELEEVDVPAHTGRGTLFRLSAVMLQTDAAQVLVGAGLEPNAQDWLRDLIRYVAAHERPPEPARV